MEHQKCYYPIVDQTSYRNWLPSFPLTVTQSETFSNVNAKAESMLEQLFKDLKIAEKNMFHAQSQQENYSNRRRKEIHFNQGDKVLLTTENLRLKGKTTTKLTPKYIGPFIIKRVL